MLLITELFLIMKVKQSSKRYRKIEEFVMEQLEKYVKLHKKHEKELKYIG